MSDYVCGLDRHKQLLFPNRLEDYVKKNNPVRAIDIYVEVLDVDALGFKTKYSDKNNNGRPAFCQKLMVKLYETLGPPHTQSEGWQRMIFVADNP